MLHYKKTEGMVSGRHIPHHAQGYPEKKNFFTRRGLSDFSVISGERAAEISLYAPCILSYDQSFPYPGRNIT